MDKENLLELIDHYAELHFSLGTAFTERLEEECREEIKEYKEKINKIINNI